MEEDFREGVEAEEGVVVGKLAKSCPDTKIPLRRVEPAAAIDAVRRLLRFIEGLSLIAVLSHTR
jgi:hypothetical protein